MRTVEQIKVGENNYIKHLNGDKCNAKVTSSLKDLQESKDTLGQKQSHLII